jgi:hypothetical protein
VRRIAYTVSVGAGGAGGLPTAGIGVSSSITGSAVTRAAGGAGNNTTAGGTNTRPDFCYWWRARNARQNNEHWVWRFWWWVWGSGYRYNLFGWHWYCWARFQWWKQNWN